VNSVMGFEEALNQPPLANTDPYLIYMQPGEYVFSKTITFYKNLTIYGAGLDKTIIRQDPAVSTNVMSGIFTIGENITVTFSHVALVGGRAEHNQGANGGVILDWGMNSHIQIFDSKLEGNFAKATGGALHIRNGSKLTVERTIFNVNTATSGAAIYAEATNAGAIDITCARFAGNIATMFGGAIADMRGIVSVKYSTFTGNSASVGKDIYNNVTSPQSDAKNNFWAGGTPTANNVLSHPFSTGDPTAPYASAIPADWYNPALFTVRPECVMQPPQVPAQIRNYPLTCVKFNFTKNSHYFSGAWLGAQKPPPFDGFGSHTGELRVTKQRFIFDGEGTDISKGRLASDLAAYPIVQVAAYYTTITTVPSPLSLTVILGNQSYSGNGTNGISNIILITNTSINLQTPIDLVLKVGPPNNPSAYPDSSIRLTQLDFCYDPGPPEPIPPLPPGAEQACTDLLADLRSRQQPFNQLELPLDQFPSDVTLEPYADFSLAALTNNEEPRLYSYDTRSGMTDVKLIPCVFKRGGALYNPDTRFSGKPIVRFTAVGGTSEQRQHLIILNYAAYYGLVHLPYPHDAEGMNLSKRWCYYGDEAFTDGNGHNRDKPEGYRNLYNVPSLTYRCDTGEFVGEYSPCVTMIATVYRAMAYFNNTAFPNGSIPVRERLAYLFFDVATWRNELSRLPQNVATPPVIHQSFTAIRVYAQADVDDPKCENDQHICGIPGTNPVTCDPKKDSKCLPAQAIVNGNWGKPILKETSPQDRTNLPADKVESIWQQIKPGDIVITVVETNSTQVPTLRNDTLTSFVPHIELVVGWGPRSSGEFARLDTQNNLFPTYTSIPEALRADYVPYIIDRFSLDGTGNERGPRPYSEYQYHTAVDFWVANAQR
jgi:hypothetical protein